MFKQNKLDSIQCPTKENLLDSAEGYQVVIIKIIERLFNAVRGLSQYIKWKRESYKVIYLIQTYLSRRKNIYGRKKDQNKRNHIIIINR